ncbi:MAG: SbcC/MukB-like Walker B domain-containing protein, partial [Candidatus Altarchaeaceae archaeon]
LNDLKKEKEEKNKNLKDIESKIPDFNVLLEIEKWFIESEKINEKFEKDRNEKIKIMNEKIKIMNEKEKIMDEFIKRSGISVERNFEKIKEKIKEKILEYERNIEEINKKINDLSLKEKLREYVNNLKEGYPCPLCGSTIHPKPLKIEDVENIKKECEKRLEDYKKEKENIENEFRILESRYNEINAMEKVYAERIKNIEEDLKNDENEKIEHDKKFLWKFIGNKESKYFLRHSPENYFADKEALNEEKKKANELNDRIRKIREEIELKEKEINEYEEKKEKEREEILKIENEISGVKSIIEDKKKQIKDEISKYKDKDLLKEIYELEESYRNIENEYKNLEKEISNLKSEIEKYNGLKEANKKYLNDIEKELENLNFQLHNKISESGYSIEEIRKILKVERTQEMIEKEEREIDEFMKNLHNAEKNLEMISKEAEGKFYDEKEYEKIKKEIMDIEEEKNKNYEKRGEIRKNLEEIKRKIKEKKEIEKEIEKFEFRRKNIEILKKLFEGEGFVKFVSRNYLKYLCMVANERFMKFTKNHLKLDVDEKEEIIVIDLLNGGNKRDIKSLSGGEKFLASLSLSLALSQIIQANLKAKQNFFFIDEGFGSLDKETLSEVMKTLMNLTKENLKIGIISHVEDLMKEIDYYLKVEKDEKRGSLIKESWK